MQNADFLKPDPLPESLREAVRYCDYCRVSTDSQKDKQISVPAQHRENRAWVFQKNGLLVREFEDAAISGETMQRPGLQEMLTYARDGAKAENGAVITRSKERGKLISVVTRNAYFDTLLVWKLDRLTRPDNDDDLDFLLIRRDLRECGIGLASVTEPWVSGATDMDQFQGYLGRGQTKLEKSTRETRFRLGRQQIAQVEGRQVGPPPYGYDWVDPVGPDGQPIPLTRAQVRKGRSWGIIEPGGSFVRFIFAQCLEGYSVIEIVRMLNDQAASPPSRSGDGGRRGGFIQKNVVGWTHDSVHHILKNRRYAGYVQYQGEWISTEGKPGGHPPLITLAQWEQAQQILAGRSVRRIANAEALFSGGLLRCPKCAERGKDSSLTVITRHAVRTLSDGSVKRYRWLAYACYTALKKRRRLKAGLVPEETCENYEIGEKRVADMLIVYLERQSRHVSEKELAKFRPEAHGSLQVDRNASLIAQRLELEKQIAQIPLMETNFQMQQAADLMSMDKLKAMLETLSAREAALKTALAHLEEDKPSEEIAPVRAAYLLHILRDEEARGLKKRDALNAAFRKIIPGLDRKSLRIYWK